MIVKLESRPFEVIAEELSCENDLDEAAELATELALSLQDEKNEPVTRSA